MCSAGAASPVIWSAEKGGDNFNSIISLGTTGLKWRPREERSSCYWFSNVTRLHLKRHMIIEDKLFLKYVQCQSFRAFSRTLHEEIIKEAQYINGSLLSETVGPKTEAP